MALRDINLIPTEVLARRQVSRHLLFWSTCLMFALTLIGGYYFYQAHLALGQAGTLLSLDDMQTDLGMRIEEIKQIKDELERLDQQQAVLSSIDRNQPYSKIIFALADMMNPDTWLTQLVIDSSQEKNGEIGLLLTGLSFSNKELGNFMDRFSNEPLFDAVQLKYAKETMMKLSNQPGEQPLRLIRFGIECRINKG
jgi:Tfp pilus assembly protein PilN